MIDVAVDIGNTRLKWGRRGAGGAVEPVSLPAGAAAVWEGQLAAWGLTGPVRWAVASVHPSRRAEFLAWVRERREDACVLDAPGQLPLRVAVEAPERVGIDRLLDAVAANARRGAGRAAVVADAGTAITVDLVDPAGAFRGGFILPGLRLMALSLHDHTALLPLVNDFGRVGPIPPGNTEDAMREGIRWCLAGGVERLARLLAERGGSYDQVDHFLTGGDAAVLHTCLPGWEVCPTLTLEGIRIAAETQP